MIHAVNEFRECIFEERFEVKDFRRTTDVEKNKFHCSLAVR